MKQAAIPIYNAVNLDSSDIEGSLKSTARAAITNLGRTVK